MKEKRELICSACEEKQDNCGAHRMRHDDYEMHYSEWYEQKSFGEWYNHMIEQGVPPILANLFPYHGKPAILNLQTFNGEGTYQIVMLRPPTAEELALYRTKFPAKPRPQFAPSSITLWLTHVD